ncbi:MULTISPECIES: hypothetical protein [Streptomyces]|uniref:Uncharacterized protein n=1 Tax=Streptomyces evansiae TaxID=3075535 RepID=A0ABU2R4J7_9ACTN|nr:MULTISPECIES: hypothetical protein [unclassified Streptomyces]MDT0411262.1 hypothetical protein [Streptomyces sp. DSM 41979]MDT0424338.1 hypothetical protein [Streptomyces sp. DSM 41859]MYQ56648.1 hypothetical protein [Streptomyces sp. SID4926]MYR29556.1 hypothetical protein [Streptomyces sp. SID4945]WEH31094.1 hypothetical protein P0D76_29250 [Streptomyces sp. AM 3-1-1]
MGNGSGETAGTGTLVVPMGWLYAEYIAEELLRSGDLMPPDSFEFRAGRDALALTVYLADTEDELSGIRVITQLETWLALTAHDQPWQDWVAERLAEAAASRPGPRRRAELRLARAAWQWLHETELLAPDLDAVPGGAAVPEEERPKVWTAAWRLGLPLGHLAIHLF